MKRDIQMTIAQKERLRQRFFRAAGPNTAAFKAMFDAAPGLCLNMKDLKGRFMALNRRARHGGDKHIAEKEEKP